MIDDSVTGPVPLPRAEVVTLDEACAILKMPVEEFRSKIAPSIGRYEKDGEEYYDLKDIMECQIKAFQEDN